MKSSLYSSFATTSLIGIANLFFAALLHRAIINNPFLVHRRRFYEAVSMLGFMFALVLTAFSAAAWPYNNAFVIVCTSAWALFCCLLVVGLLRNQQRRLANNELEIPNLWIHEQEPDEHWELAKPQKTNTRPPGRIQITIDANASGKIREPSLPTAYNNWQSALRKSRRLKLSTDERNYITNLWFQKNRSVYDCSTTPSKPHS